ncbi:MAG TPA: MOSC N-terminal beta barrel domain-containing protein [Longimicrobiales bacterium]|nr:MOSC N-terminal beta barrel domain-containing protein [Longimicrobiales bacterium]
MDDAIPPDPTAAPTVSWLRIYPVKGAAGIPLEAAELDACGFRWDRRWLVTDPAGEFFTQRELPRLALLRTRIEGDALVLDFPGAAPLRVPLEEPAAARSPVRVWDDVVEAAPVGPEAAAWLSEVLGTPCRLMRFPADARRPVDPRYAVAGAADRVAFPDGYPILLLSEASLAELNRRLATPVPMERFRPSLVVAGTAPHAEDGWRRLEVAGVRLHVVKPCARCVVTTVDQATGVAGKEPLRTLARYRKVGSKVLFGQNVIHEGRGTIRLGDRVTVL